IGKALANPSQRASLLQPEQRTPLRAIDRPYSYPNIVAVDDEPLTPPTRRRGRRTIRPNRLPESSHRPLRDHQPNPRIEAHSKGGPVALWHRSWGRIWLAWREQGEVNVPFEQRQIR